MDEQYIDNLDEYVQDEGQIVTYKWLSLTFNVSCNTAKQMLFHYVSNQRNLDKDVKLNATYLISGVIYDAKLKQDVHKVCVVHESNLTVVKEEFKQILSLHLYSIQKARLLDLNLLYVVDYDKVKENVYETSKNSAITCPSIHIRSSDEITTLKSQSAYKSSSPTKANVSKGSTALELKQKVTENENKENKLKVEVGLHETESNKNLNRSKKIVPNRKKVGIASMFANQSKKIEDKNAQGISKCKEEAISTESESDAGPIVSTCTESKTGEKDVAKFTVKNKDKKVQPKSENINSESLSLPKPKNAIKHSKKRKIAPRKRNSDKEDPLASFKRRRIMTMDSSSESSSEENEEMDEDPTPTTATLSIESDDEDVIPSTPQSISVDLAEIAKGKKRKLVNKTFMDEDGFLVTKKEYEFTSDCSDGESLLPKTKKVQSPKKKTASPKKKGKSPRISKKKSPIKTKQASITSFFKRN